MKITEQEKPKSFCDDESERNQDIFLSWLLWYGKEEYAEGKFSILHSIACNLIQVMIGETIEVNTVKIWRQKKNIDLLAIVNNQYAIIIEDKTETSTHDDQLFRYTESVLSDNQKKGKIYNIRCVYYKSGNESLSNLQNMERTYNGKIYEKYKNTDTHIAPLKILTRSDMLKILTSTVCGNDTLNDYIAYLHEIERLSNLYKERKVTQWGSRAWEGFCMEIDNKLAELCPKWDHQKYNGGIELSLKSIAIRNTNVKFFLQIKGDKKDEKLQGTRVLFCIKGVKSIAKDWKMPKEWKTAITIFKTGMEGPKIIPLKYYKDNDKKTFAYIKGKDFFGTEQVDVAEIVYKLVDWHKKLQALAKELSKTEVANQCNNQQ